MSIDWTALAAVSSLGQLLVVAGATFFAVVQIQQLRKQNELQATLPYFAYTRTHEFNEAFRIVRELREGPRDESLEHALASGQLDDVRVQALFQLSNFFSELGALVQERLVVAESVVPFFRWQILATWEVMLPYIRQRRSSGVPALWVSFETLVIRASALSDEDRIARNRRLLPRALRTQFDRSVLRSGTVE